MQRDWTAIGNINESRENILELNESILNNISVSCFTAPDVRIFSFARVSFFAHCYCHLSAASLSFPI
jgi:hypothetical protein